MGNNTSFSYKGKWIQRPRPQKYATVRLFCFPYAGSSGVVTYKKLVDILPHTIEVCPIELPGRGVRMSEKLINNLDEVIFEIFKEMQNLSELPFIFFGHSMGGLLSYELSRLLSEEDKSLPKKLYISAHRAPFLKLEDKIKHKLKETEFRSELLRMNGIAKEIWDNEELLELVLPIIKNDYQLCETYTYVENEKLEIPITTFGGTKDEDVTEYHLKAWKTITNSKFELNMFEGDHFFILDKNSKFLNKFSKILTDDLAKF